MRKLPLFMPLVALLLHALLTAPGALAAPGPGPSPSTGGGCTNDCTLTGTTATATLSNTSGISTLAPFNLCTGGALCGGSFGSRVNMVWSSAANYFQSPVNMYVGWTGTPNASINPVMGLNISVRDAMDNTLAPGNIGYGSAFVLASQTGAKGLKVGMIAKSTIQGTPGDNAEHMGLQAWGIVETGQTTSGNVYGANLKASAIGDMTGGAMLAATEFSLSSPGTIAGYRYLWYGKLYTDGTNQGATGDAAFAVFNDSAQSSTYGFANGWNVGAGNGYFPLSTTGSLINLVLGLGVSATMGSVVNIPAGFTVSSYYWNSPNWTMTGAGVSTQAGNATVGTGQTTTLISGGGTNQAFLKTLGAGAGNLLLLSNNSSAVIAENNNGGIISRSQDIAAGGTGTNYVQFNNATTGNTPVVGTAGADTNINLNITTKGSGVLQINGTAAVSCAAASVTLASLVVTNGIVTHC